MIIDGLTLPVPERRWFEEWRAGGVSAVHATVAIWEGAAEALALLGKWRRVLAESSESAELIGQGGAAEWAADAWQLLHRWRLDPAAQRAYPDQLDYRAFLSWCRSYRERLEGHGWIDRVELEATLATRTLDGKGRYVAADLVEVYPTRTALFAQLSAHGRTVTATTAPMVAATSKTWK